MRLRPPLNVPSQGPQWRSAKGSAEGQNVRLGKAGSRAIVDVALQTLGVKSRLTSGRRMDHPSRRVQRQLRLGPTVNAVRGPIAHRKYALAQRLRCESEAAPTLERRDLTEDATRHDSSSSPIGPAGGYQPRLPADVQGSLAGLATAVACAMLPPAPPAGRAQRDQHEAAPAT